MDKFSKIAEKIKTAPVIFSLLLIIFGAVLIIFSDITLTIICFVAGVFIILNGVLSIIDYARYKNQLPFMQFKLVTGIIQVVVGSYFGLFAYGFIHILYFIFGIYLILNGIKHMQNAKTRKMYNDRIWIWLNILGWISVVCGIAIIFFSSADWIIKLIGGCLIYNGITNIIATIIKKREENILYDDEDVE